MYALMRLVRCRILCLLSAAVKLLPLLIQRRSQERAFLLPIAQHGKHGKHGNGVIGVRPPRYPVRPKNGIWWGRRISRCFHCNYCGIDYLSLVGSITAKRLESRHCGSVHQLSKAPCKHRNTIILITAVHMCEKVEVCRKRTSVMTRMTVNSRSSCETGVRSNHKDTLF